MQGTMANMLGNPNNTPAKCDGVPYCHKVVYYSILEALQPMLNLKG